MKKTVFWEKHKGLNAKMVEFAGYEMPIEYVGLTKEHLAVRNDAGLFDVSHMGEIWVKGEKAKDYLQYITSNDLNSLVPGKACYSCLLNDKGGIVDDLIIYHYEDNKYLLVVNAANIEKDYNWLVANNSDLNGPEIENASDEISQLAIQGPKAEQLVQELTTEDLSGIKSFRFIVGNFAGEDNVIISKTGYTGESGFELYFYNASALNIWDKIWKVGEKHNLTPIGLGARDTLRLEKGLCLYGHELSDSIDPYSAGLAWITKLKNKNDVIAKDILQNKKNSLTSKLVGIKLSERGIPRQGYKIMNDAESETEIGEITSGTMSPVLKQGIGMAYINKEFAEPGQTVYLQVRNKNIKAQVVKLPFF